MAETETLVFKTAEGELRLVEVQELLLEGVTYAALVPEEVLLAAQDGIAPLDATKIQVYYSEKRGGQYPVVSNPGVLAALAFLFQASMADIVTSLAGEA